MNINKSDFISLFIILVLFIILEGFKYSCSNLPFFISQNKTYKIKSDNSINNFDFSIIKITDKVPGIGKSTLENIILYIQKNSPSSWNDLLSIKGIGDKRLQLLRTFYEK